MIPELLLITGAILSPLVGLGVIAAVWRLNSSVAKLTASMEIYIERTNDHEDRIRNLEKHP